MTDQPGFTRTVDRYNCISAVLLIRTDPDEAPIVAKAVATMSWDDKRPDRPTGYRVLWAATVDIGKSSDPDTPVAHVIASVRAEGDLELGELIGRIKETGLLLPAQSENPTTLVLDESFEGVRGVNSGH